MYQEILRLIACMNMNGEMYTICAVVCGDGSQTPKTWNNMRNRTHAGFHHAATYTPHSTHTHTHMQPQPANFNDAEERRPWYIGASRQFGPFVSLRIFSSFRRSPSYFRRFFFQCSPFLPFSDEILLLILILHESSRAENIVSSESVENDAECVCVCVCVRCIRICASQNALHICNYIDRL